MSAIESPSAHRPYGLARVCRAWRLPRSSAQLLRHRRKGPAEAAEPARRGPKTALSDQEILDAIRQAILESPWVGEGHRKMWAYLRSKGVRTRRDRVLRIMRENGLLAPSRRGSSPGPRVHDGSIVTDRPDSMWGTDATGTITAEGLATIFLAHRVLATTAPASASASTPRDEAPDTRPSNPSDRPYATRSAPSPKASPGP